jgi:hypothetical protein
MNIQKIKESEYQYGLEKEKCLVKRIISFLENEGYSDIKETNRYNIFDFKGGGKNQVLCELKTRRCNKSDYQTTIIGKNKYDKTIEEIGKGYDVYYFFEFTNNQLYFYKVNKVDEFNTKNIYRRDIKQHKEHIEIPTKLLKKIEK